MKSNGRLLTFGEVKTNNTQDLYIPGELEPLRTLLPTVYEESIERNLPEVTYEEKTAEAIPGLPKFQTGQSLRKWGKERIIKALRVIPPNAIYTPSGTIPTERETPTVPRYFVDGVPDFSEVQFGQGNQYQDTNPTGQERGIWGQLISALTKGAEMYFQAERAPYELKIAEAERKIAEAKAGLAAPKTDILPLLLIGGAILLLAMKPKKPERVYVIRKRR